jgi:hypothetical protein
MVFDDCGILERVLTVFSRWSVRRVSLGQEWAEEALHLVEEADKHFATREGREEVVFVALDDGGMFIPEVVTIKGDVVDCIALAAVWAGHIVAGAHSEVG